MEISAAVIENITILVWATTLEQELTPCPDLTEEAALVGLIELTGGFEGTIAVHLSESMVRGAASQMFAVPARDVDDEMMRDTVAELANMIGGNAKCLVELPTKIGLPRVVTPEAARQRYPEAEGQRMGFVSPLGKVTVAVHRDSAA